MKWGQMIYEIDKHELDDDDPNNKHNFEHIIVCDHILIPIVDSPMHPLNTSTYVKCVQCRKTVHISIKPVQ